ncbi:MAG: YHYH protein [Proteobacteria bacterium]|jgi:hypothetical protein|nr:YHYH protein [Pseudomonadota bacterium]MDA1291663.1 YHYH protein [Pseudomonadota bacterium]
MQLLKRICFALVYSSLSSIASADTLDNAQAVFDFAEAAYPELLSPAAPEIQEIQGFYVRLYTDTGIYLGVQGDNVYAIGGAVGPDLVSVGKISSLIAVNDTDITDLLLTNRREECSYYAENRFSNVSDIKRSMQFMGSITITVEGSECVLVSNSIPNHDFNDATAAFAIQVSEVSAEFKIPTEPAFASSATPISLATDNAVFLNGVKLDLLAAGCFGVGDGNIGCNDIDQPWRYDPMSPLTMFGTDANNAHPQPDGTYHYHGNPKALFDQNAMSQSPVIGFAADGFPIFGSYIDDNGQIRTVTSSFQLLSGSRPSSADDPGGIYDGTFVDDHEYVSGSGDLDECNGMMRDGSYGYYVTDAYPWVLACFKGTPDSSFDKAGGGGGPPPP